MSLGRRSWRPALAAALLVLAVSTPARPDPAAASSAAADGAGQAVQATQATQVAAPAGRPQLGVSAFLLWRDWPMVDTLLARVAASGTPWLRVDAGWCSLQEQGASTVSTWYRDRLDHVVERANALGLKLLVMVGCAPAWAGGSTYHDYPTDPATYQAAMTYLATRYVGRVNAWEIWNEPDCVGGCGNGSAAAYVPVLRAGFKGVRAGDPRALVVTGGVSGNNVAWLRQMYAAGAAGWFDALATHPYIDPTTAGPERPAYNRYSIRAVADVRALMVANGDAAKPIWFTELGWSTRSDAAGVSGGHTGVSAATQAAYLTRTVPVLREYPYVDHAFWYVLRDRDDSSSYENGFGLLRVDGSAKPSWSAYVAAVAGLAP